MVRPASVVYRSFLRDSTRWDGFAFRPDDIVISTPTKCGTTWTQMICALLVFQSAELPASLSRISPWLDMLTRPRDEVVTDLEAQQHRRFIKTHLPLDGLPYDDQVTYISVGRDPRDVALSWDNHRQNQDREATARARDLAVGEANRPVDPHPPPAAGQPVLTPRERLLAWVDDDTQPTEAACSLWLTLHHLATFWPLRDERNVVLLHYADLQRDLDGQMRHLSSRLDIPVDEELWPSLLDAASLATMRERADRLAPDADVGIWHDNRRFFHRGTRGQWRDLLDDADLAHYEPRVAELASPELAAWVHHGSSRSTVVSA